MNMFEKIFAFLLPKAKKTPAVAWWLLSKSPKLLRRGVQLVSIYAFSYVAEKLLDYMHDRFPDNILIAKLDKLSHILVNSENVIIGGVTSMAKAGYDAIPLADIAVLPKTQSMPDLTKTGAYIPPVSAASLLPVPPTPSALPPDVNKSSEQALSSVEPAARNRANRAVALAPAVVLAPDGFPANGGYDPVTEITWGPYMKSIKPSPLPTMKPGYFPKP